jgi:outer membrane protein TolC
LVKEPIKFTDSLDQLYLSARIAVQQLLQNETISNPLLSQYLAKQKVLETELQLKRELIKPVLDVSYNFLSSDNQNNLQSFTTNAYKWGATFSLPLYLRKSRNEYKMAQLALQNNELETINKQNQFANKRKFIVDALRVCQEQITTAEKSVNYSNLLVEAEKLKFMNGESSLFLVNARENKWLENELKLAEYKLKYLKTILELVYTDGNLNFELS